MKVTAFLGSVIATRVLALTVRYRADLVMPMIAP